MEQKNTPLFDGLRKHAEKNATSFHVPGHKSGSVFSKDASSFYKNILEIDVTEITGMDDLHQPKEMIWEAEELTRQLYGTEASYFLVGGSTVGNLAMIMGTVEEGDTIIVQKNSHQSVFHAVELSGARAVYLEVEIDVETGLSLGVSLETMEDAIEAYGEAKAVVLTNPSYEGYGQDLIEHIGLAHAANITVIIDEAHGPHLLFQDERWPKTSLQAGADLVVHSVHKMLPAMTMTSILHINSKRIDKKRVKRLLTMLQSSSPSYPLMASIDIARAYLAYMLEEKRQTEITDKIMNVRKKIGNGLEWRQAPQIIGDYVQDPLKLALVTASYSGLQLQKKLEANNIFPELASPGHVLLTLPLTEDDSLFATMEKELRQVLLEKEAGVPVKGERKVMNSLQCRSSITLPALTFSEVEKSKTERVNWTEVEGRIIAETMTPYPPGIPVILKGEKVRQEHIEKFEMIIDHEINLQTDEVWKEKGILVVSESGNEEIES